ncbi:MAG: hypothetical protein V4516_08330 [Pseudomonadota bacterium]
MKDELGTTGRSEMRGNFGAAARPIVTVDVEKYQSYLDGSNLSEAQKREFLEALWSIVITFVELGFGVHPLQEVCGKPEDAALPSPKDAFDQVRSAGTEQQEKPIDSGPKEGPEPK